MEKGCFYYQAASDFYLDVEQNNFYFLKVSTISRRIIRS